MKKSVKVLALLLGTMILSACGNLKNSNLANNSQTSSSQKAKSFQTTDTGRGGYTVLLKDGQYVVSPIAGLTATVNDNSVDTREFERGLIKISETKFPIGSYVFQEGQYLKPETVNKWLARQSSSNSLGLNPKKGASSNYQPYYLEQITEQDYLTGSGTNYHLSGMSVGLALNSVDYYQKKKDGPEYQKKISRSQQLTYGKEIASKVIKRLRTQKGLRKIPITIGLFSKTSKDSLVGGSYISYGTSASNSSKIANWKSVSEQTEVLPTVGNAKSINSNDDSSFNSFKEAIQNYFPNVSGVTATLRYENGKLSQENISITTQFYGYEQIQSFTRLVLSTAKKYLSNNVPIEIKIGSVNDVQALVAKETADSEYQVHVYGGK